MKVIRVGAMWCPACIKMNKYWNTVKEKYSDIEFSEFDLDMDEDEVGKLNIGNILPEIIVYKDDKELGRIIGEKTQEQFEKELGDLVDKEC